jgi:hypothetical protein
MWGHDLSELWPDQRDWRSSPSEELESWGLSSELSTGVSDEDPILQRVDLGMDQPSA